MKQEITRWICRILGKMVCDGHYQMLVVVDAADGDAAEKALA